MDSRQGVPLDEDGGGDSRKDTPSNVHLHGEATQLTDQREIDPIPPSLSGRTSYA